MKRIEAARKFMIDDLERRSGEMTKEEEENFCNRRKGASFYASPVWWGGIDVIIRQLIIPCVQVVIDTNEIYDSFESRVFVG